jgi:DNA-binding transcriptional LysR family regulator
MELLDLKIFCDLVELKSFTGAAERNCLTQSAVSQRINRLNEYYGNKIFLNKKPLTLSWHGKFIYEKFKDILKIYSHAEEIIEQKEAREIISMGFSENAKAKYFNHDFVDRLLGNNFLPEVYFGPSRSVYEKVLFGTLDYGIVGSPYQKSAQIEFDRLYTEKIVLVTSAENPVENVNLHEVPVVLDHRDSGLYQFLKNKLLALDIDLEDLNIKGYFGTSGDKFRILKGSRLYCFMPEQYLKQNAGLRVVPLAVELTRHFYEIYQKKNAGKIASLTELIRKSNNLLK